MAEYITAEVAEYSVNAREQGALEDIHAGGRWGLMARRRRRFFGFFSFLRHFLLVFVGIRRTCGHAITPCDSLSALLTVPCCTIDHLHSSRP